MGSQPAFFDHLTRDQLDALEDYASEPGVTIADCIGWVAIEAGVSVSKSAMGRWKQALNERLIAERASGAGKLAKAFADACRESGGVAVPDAAIQMVSQLVFDAAYRASDDKETNTKDIANLALSVQRVTLGKQRIEAIKAEHEAEKRRAATEAKSMAKAGASGADIADKLAEMFGVEVHEEPAAEGDAV